MVTENPWQKLAELPVPPPPPKFNADLHQKINRRLLVGQVFDLFFRVSAHAVGHFSRAVWALVRYTVTGEYPPERKES